MVVERQELVDGHGKRPAENKQAENPRREFVKPPRFNQGADQEWKANNAPEQGSPRSKLFNRETWIRA